MQHLNERNVFTKTITIIQIMNEMCTWTNLVHRTNIGISPLNTFRVMIILRLLLLLTNLHLKLLSTQGTGADKLLSTQSVHHC